MSLLVLSVARSAPLFSFLLHSSLFSTRRRSENVSGGVHVEYTILGRSGLKVSIVGLGCGGPSRLGQATGKSERESIAVVQQALELGITLFDTAEVYGTETIVGRALEAVPRDQLIISTKKLPP